MEIQIVDKSIEFFFNFYDFKCQLNKMSENYNEIIHSATQIIALLEQKTQLVRHKLLYERNLVQISELREQLFEFETIIEWITEQLWILSQKIQQSLNE